MPSCPVIYYLTEDVHNAKERNELELLRQVARVILVSVAANAPSQHNTLGLKQVSVAAPPLWLTRAYVHWSRICLLLCRLANSKTDREFPSRNIYLHSALVKHVVNILWRLKRHPWINSKLPRYDTLYFLPLKLGLWIQGRRYRRQRSQRRYTRLLIHDALLIRLNRLAPLVAYARAQGIKTVANVKSWDNPFYSQLTTHSDGYLVWSESMWQDIQQAHEVRKSFVYAWGARPFVNLIQATENGETSNQTTQSRCIRLGYAAAFCDEVMGAHEVALLVELSRHLEQALPQAVICFRPYPTLPETFYAPLRNRPNVQWVGIAGSAIDRYGDGREFIRFGSEEERLRYLAHCDTFLSLATSFSIEAVIAGRPTVHFYLPLGNRQSRAEIEIFKRIDISDHLLKYYLQYLPVVRSYQELLDWIKAASHHPLESNTLLRQMGIPASFREATNAWSGLKQKLLPWIQGAGHHA